jgi:hypothetical protein
MTSEGRFILHRFNGDEVYRIHSAAMLTHPIEDGVMLWFQVQAETPALQTLPDTEVLKARPNAEVGIALPSVDLTQLAGHSFSVPSAYDNEMEDYVASIYYCEHEDLNENEVVVLERRGSAFRVYWTASTTDVNYYDGSKARTRVEIDGWFRFTDKGNPNCS